MSLRFILVIALFLFAGCGHDSTRPAVWSASLITVSADSTWHIIGGVLDAERGEPLIGANAFLQYRISGSDSVRVGGAATNANGAFTIIVRSFSKPYLLRLVASYAGYKDSSLIIPQFSGSDSLRIEFLRLRYDSDRRGVILDPVHRPMFDKHQTNSRVVIEQEDIRNLPTPK